MKNVCRRVTVRSWLVVGLMLFAATTPVQSAAGQEFVLRESLGQDWRNESVRFELSAQQLQHVQAGHVLIDAQSNVIPYQLTASADGKPRSIVFAVDLNPFEQQRYQFSESKQTLQDTDLKIDDRVEFLELTNSMTGISLRRRLKPGEGPIEGIRLTTGGWIGGSRLNAANEITDYSVQLTARGPVFAEAICRIHFGSDRSWEMKVRLQAHEPVILIDEEFSTGDKSEFRLALGADFSPDRLFYRAGNNIVGRNSTWKIDGNDSQQVFVLEPWLHWWERDRQGNWFGLYSSSGHNLLTLAVLQPGLWIDPSVAAEKRSAAQVLVTQADDNLWATFPLRGGRRQWMIAAFDQQAALELPAPLPSGRGEPISRAATLPQRYLIKHGDFPLDRVKDVTASWKDTQQAHPRPLVSDASLREFRQRFPINPARLEKFRRSPVIEYDMDEPVAYYFATKDAALGRHLADEAVRILQIEVDNFYQQNAGSTLGVEPHRRANNLLPAINLAALALHSDQISPKQTERLRSQLAFLGDTVTRPDFYSPARGYSANPNMTSTVSAFQVRIAGAIPTHPKAADWMSGGMNELKRELQHWSDENGGWLEAPHYALVAYDSLLGCFLAAHEAGVDDVLFDPKMKKVAEWLAKSSTPPDVRLAGRRHLPPIGNTYQREPTGIFAHLAVIWRQEDPQFAAQMQWMHQQQGSPPSPGIGGFYPTLAGYRLLLTDPDLPTKEPEWHSERFPESGVILRNGFPTDRETQLYLIAGRLHDHYDDDSGSFTLWGKGRLLANDFGYTGVAAADDHNLVVSSRAQRGVMQVEDFATTDRFDVVKGKRDGWTRQIAFVKDPDPLGQNYFVLCDSLNEPAPMKWQLWLTANRVTTKSNAALVEGLDDVDLDIVFASRNEITLRTEQKSRTCLGMRPDGSVDSQQVTTQTGLFAQLSEADRITVVLFPRPSNEKPPEITALANGNVIRVRSNADTDYIFQSPQPFTFHEGDVQFEGTSGLVQYRRGTLTLALGASGRIVVGDKELQEDHAALRTWNLPPNNE